MYIIDIFRKLHICMYITSVFTTVFILNISGSTETFQMTYFSGVCFYSVIMIGYLLSY